MLAAGVFGLINTDGQGTEQFFKTYPNGTIGTGLAMTRAEGTWWPAFPLTRVGIFSSTSPRPMRQVFDPLNPFHLANDRVGFVFIGLEIGANDLD